VVHLDVEGLQGFDGKGLAEQTLVRILEVDCTLESLEVAGLVGVSAAFVVLKASCPLEGVGVEVASGEGSLHHMDTPACLEKKKKQKQ